LAIEYLLKAKLLSVPDEKAKKEELKSDHLLNAIEEAYPNSLTVDDMAKYA